VPDNERRKADEDLVIKLIERRDQAPERDRLTPRMFARYIIDALDEQRANDAR
jgi:hypothetical protein